MDTDDREAATEPEASGNKLPAAQSATNGVEGPEPGLSKHEIHTTLSVKATSRARHRPLLPFAKEVMEVNGLKEQRIQMF